VQFIQPQVNTLVVISNHLLLIGMVIMRLIDTLLIADIIVGKVIEKITSRVFFSEVWGRFSRKLTKCQTFVNCAF
jgi:hypothetical protein